MRLYLVRHGEAGRASSDAARPLTPGGKNEIARIAQEAATRGVDVDEIRHSGRLRAQETAEILAGALPLKSSPSAIDGLHPGDPVQPIAMSLMGETKALMLVGHLPFMGCLAGFLLTGDEERAPVRFTTGTLACLEGDLDGWEVSWVIHPYEL